MDVREAVALPDGQTVPLIMVTGLYSENEKSALRDARRQAFESLIQQCWDRLWSYAYRTTGNRDDAEDLLSESLLEGFRSFHQFRGDTPFIRWMFRVMTTTRIDMVRRASRRKTLPLNGFCVEGDDARSAMEPADEAADPQRMILTGVLDGPIQHALSALSEEFRTVVILADIEELDYSEVSRILRVPIGTVRSRLHRARNQLRKALSQYVEENW
jgi:RNA polymerase sigma-70 factor (ECF subfamily)